MTAPSGWSGRAAGRSPAGSSSSGPWGFRLRTLPVYTLAPGCTTRAPPAYGQGLWRLGAVAGRPVGSNPAVFQHSRGGLSSSEGSVRARSDHFPGFFRPLRRVTSKTGYRRVKGQGSRQPKASACLGPTRIWRCSMNTTTRTAALALTLVVSVGAASETLAEGRRTNEYPRPLTALTVPNLDFAYRVTSVDPSRTNVFRPRTPAAQIRLDTGDVAPSINGRPLTHIGAHLPAFEATDSGDSGTLVVPDGRAGRVIFRPANLFYPNQRIGQRETTSGMPDCR